MLNGNIGFGKSKKVNIESIKGVLQMIKKRVVILFLSCICAICGCGNAGVATESSGIQEEKKYQTEEDILKAMETEEMVQALGKFYTSKFYMDYKTHIRLIDTDGNIYKPEYEILLDDNVIKEIPKNEHYFYKPVFKFDAKNQTFEDDQTSEVINAGLQYEVDDDGMIVCNKKILDLYRFPEQLSNGTYNSGSGIDNAGITERIGENNFSEEFFSWITDVRKSAEQMSAFSNNSSYMDTIVSYDAEYMWCYVIIQWRDGKYDSYTCPSGIRQIEIRMRDDGKYEVSEKRTYYLNTEFLENEEDYSEDMLKKEVQAITVIPQNTISSAFKDAITLDTSNLKPTLDETRYYLVESMPETLKSMIEQIQNSVQ